MSASIPPRRGAVILVVDDDPVLCSLLDTVLEHAGFTVIIAQHGLDALWAARWYQPDLVLMDLVMPVLDGTAALRELLRAPDTRWQARVAMSAPERLPAVAAERLVDAVISKPLDIDELLAKVHIQLARVERPIGLQEPT